MTAFSVQRSAFRFLGVVVVVGATLPSRPVGGQGVLTPPGAPAPTMKTLQQVEPRGDVRTLPAGGGALHHISASGAYYLSGNVTGVTGQAGIYISANDVDLDLNGFKLVGVAGATHGIATDVIRGVRIHRGRVKGWPGVGINGEEATAGQLAQVVVENCGGEGIFLGNEARVADCSVVGCNDGIVVGAGSLVTDSQVKNNVFSGISTGADSTIKDVTALANGRDGVRLGANSRIAGCVTKGNGRNGVTVGGGSVIENCTAASNLGTGIVAAASCTIRGSTVVSNALIGIRVDRGCAIRDCTTAFNLNNGITTGDGATVSGCTVVSNTTYGIRGQSGNLIEDCTLVGNLGGIRADGGGNRIKGCVAYENRGDGIIIGGGAVVGCTVTGNTGDGISGNGHFLENICRGNTGDGIQAGSNSRVEGNQVEFNNRGIYVPFGGALIIKNSASGNGFGNYVFSGALTFGPTNSLSGEVSNTNPWRNFSD